jgi:hypothetical protein
VSAKLELLMRDVRDSDHAFVLSHWIRLCRIAPANRYVPNDLFYPRQRQVCECLLRESRTRIACDPSDEEHVYGYICHDFEHKGALHWVYTKPDYRMLGVAREMLRQELTQWRDTPAALFATHATAEVFSSGLDEKLGIFYAPFLLNFHHPSLVNPPSCRDLHTHRTLLTAI